MERQLAPIVVFAFNRPDHLVRTLDALAACAEARKSHLRIYCDGARDDRDTDAVSKVIEIARKESRFLNSEVVISYQNRGLARSIIDGVTVTVNEFGRVIVLEDDIVVSHHFLTFMNAALEKYEHSELVASVCGYMYPIDDQGLPPSFFLRGTDCWGWATWKRCWEIFEPNGQLLLSQILEKKLAWEFDFDGSYPYTKMLKDQIGGRNNSWAIRWHASAYLRGMMSCFPTRSFIQNIGLDGTGTHCEPTTKCSVDFDNSFDLLSLSDDIRENFEARRRIGQFLLQTQSTKFRLQRLVRLIPRLLRSKDSSKW
jgi:uncharacterized protein YbaR (Trm112 family)